MPSNDRLNNQMVKQDTMGYFTTLPDIKRIYVYLNGELHQSATTFIVHPRRIRSYEVFLQDLTEKLKPGFGAIRNVYTPVNGSKVRDLEDLENHQKYVVAGKDTFRKLRYADIDMREAKRRTSKKSTNIAKLPVVTQNKVHKSTRKRPYGWEILRIFVYKNGDDVTPPVRISIRRTELENWEHILLRISDRLDQTGFVKRLYNLNGDWVRGPNGIKNGQYYVAVSGYDSFKQVMYGKLLDRLPQEFLKPSPQFRKKKTSPSTTKKNEVHKVIPKIKAPNNSKRSTHKTTKNQAADNNNNTTALETTPKVKDAATAKPHHIVRPKKPPPTIEEEADHTRPSKANTDTARSPYINNTKPRDAKSNITENRRDSITARELRSESLRRASIPRHVPTNLNSGAVVILKSPNSGKSPPDSEDSAYISENERWERRGSKNELRPRSFKVLDERPSAARGERIYYASTPKKASQKRVTLVDYDEDASGLYKAKPPTGERRKVPEVAEIENVPVELPLDEVEATEVGETSDDYDEEEEEEYYRNIEKHHREYPPVTHSESDLRSSAKTAS